ncbi:oleate hydratase [Bradyrhizobium sp. CCBAU 11357]|uniref:oleate hydratase n=1 Tax=Bradyrhizobium sp. CCBAU 11357 TaxID=1630808 RepID=UPI002304C1A4|nr:oleate hydratase [Bradyrhizobium sp. CCBAU 11357]
MADRITILEWLNLPGGALDGSWDPERGFVIRGDPEMEEHFECLWDLFRSFYWLKYSVGRRWKPSISSSD